MECIVLGKGRQLALTRHNILIGSERWRVWRRERKSGRKPSRTTHQNQKISRSSLDHGRSVTHGIDENLCPYRVRECASYLYKYPLSPQISQVVYESYVKGVCVSGGRYNHSIAGNDDDSNVLYHQVPWPDYKGYVWTYLYVSWKFIEETSCFNMCLSMCLVKQEKREREIMLDIHYTV